MWKSVEYKQAHILCFIQSWMPCMMGRENVRLSECDRECERERSKRAWRNEYKRVNWMDEENMEKFKLNCHKIQVVLVLSASFHSSQSTKVHVLCSLLVFSSISSTQNSKLPSISFAFSHTLNYFDNFSTMFSF